MEVNKAPLISVCIPARNEQALIGKCLESIRRAEKVLNEPVEIIVALNRCTDDTEQIAKSYNAIIVNEDAKNLSRIRNAAAKRATGRILVTIDADSWMSSNMFVEIKRMIDSGKVIGGGVLIKPERLSPGIVVTAVIIAAATLPLGLSAGLFWCLKSDFDAIGGFDENMLIAEDADFAWRLKQAGKKKGLRFRPILKAHIVSSCRKFDQFGDWYFINPSLLLKFARGKDQKTADKHWYDVAR